MNKSGWQPSITELGTGNGQMTDIVAVQSVCSKHIEKNQGVWKELFDQNVS